MANVPYVTLTPLAVSKIEKMDKVSKEKIEIFRDRIVDRSVKDFLNFHKDKIKKIKHPELKGLFVYRLSQSLRLIFCINDDGSVSFTDLLDKRWDKFPQERAKL